MDPRLTTIPMPARIARLRRDARGYPVPWFVADVNGVPDFRVVDAAKMNLAVVQRRCWLCGDVLGRYLSFVVGPMCAVNRVSSEPPSHRECAEYAARVCPFLTRPHMHRRENDIPDHMPAGVMLARNPGVALVWTTTSYRVRRVLATDGPGARPGVLFAMGAPTAVSWWAEGRPASRTEVVDSIESGLPVLRELADHDGPADAGALAAAVVTAYELVPVE